MPDPTYRVIIACVSLGNSYTFKVYDSSGVIYNHSTTISTRQIIDSGVFVTTANNVTKIEITATAASGTYIYTINYGSASGDRVKVGTPGSIPSNDFTIAWDQSATENVIVLMENQTLV